MAYKVIFVEDEIITREGIRDNVDWSGNGFTLCGEASDGEMALQLLQAVKPDLLITDIKMPFMDGLQLSRIVRERMPWVKIVILSGHDEFLYAQEAIKLGVTEYLLKPVTVPDLNMVLRKIAKKLEQERAEQENLRRLHDQLEESQAALKEKFLLKLVVGAASPFANLTEVLEKSQQLGLDLIAGCYQVVILHMEISDRSEPFNYDVYQRVVQILADAVKDRADIYFLHKDWEEFVLFMMGSTPEQIEAQWNTIWEHISREIKGTHYHLVAGVGGPQYRITSIYQSFVEALAHMQNARVANTAGSQVAIEKTELPKMDNSAIEHYLRSGAQEDFPKFFDGYIRPISATALKSPWIKNYILVDVVLATAKFVNELGGDIDQSVSVLNSIETILMNIRTVEQLREQVFQILSGALAFRDAQANHSYAGMIQAAKAYIDQQYRNPDLLINEVAAQVNLSPSHFSVVFHQETGQTFKDYLTAYRIEKAKELLRMTGLKFAEVAYQTGYSDPHYFSQVFHKHTGMSPSDFRLRVAETAPAKVGSEK